MGANIECSGNIARIDGVETLRGALVRARDLRGGAADGGSPGADGWTEYQNVNILSGDMKIFAGTCGH